MDYKKKYEQALEKASKLRVQNPFDTVGQMVEHIFPELKENEDDRMRKALKQGFFHYGNSFTTFGGINVVDIIAWLEKQGESDETKAKMFLINKGYPIDTNGIFPTYEEMYNIIRDGFEKQGEQESIDYNEELKKCRENPLYFIDKYVKFEERKPAWSKEDERMRKEIIDFLRLPHPQFVGKRDHEKWIDWLEKQGKKRPTDKVEPKFKVGDWIIFNGLILHIDEVINGYYRTTSRGDGIHNSYDWDIDNAARLWTIQEAKDGDVLVCNINRAEIGGDVEKLPNMTPTICIYQNVVKDSDYIHSYCSLYDENSLVLQNTMYYNAFVCNIHPATKEQCDTLFAKMKEAGYGWNNERKELKKIEQNPADKSKFKVGDWFVNNNRKDVFLIKSIDANGYCTLEDIKGNIISPCLPPCESDSHIWTIEDAKDGDVLIKEETGEPFIYNGNRGSYIPEFLGAYCGISDGRFRPNGSTYYWGKPSCPATNEQRDLLFQKMKEAGYEWDANKKELKKIEPKTIDADKVIEWLENTIKETTENYGVYKEIRLTLPYNSVEDLINDFKEDFGLC